MTDGKAAIAYLHPGQVEGHFHLCLMKLVLRHLGGDGVRLGSHLATESGSGGIAAARNEVVRQFLKTDDEWLFWLDADMGFAPDTLERLLATADPVERPIVGALAFSHSSLDGSQSPLGDVQYRTMPTIYRFTQQGVLPTAYTPGDVVECDATGSACVVVHRSVFEAMADRFDVGAPFYFRMAHEGLEWGEDITFCMRAKALGFPVHVDTSVKTSHKKVTYITEGTFLAEQAAYRQASDDVISLLVPSRGRPEQLAQMWATATETAARPELIELVVRLDEDDPDLGSYVANLSGSERELAVIGPRLLLSSCWNEAYDKASGEILMHCGDDIRFRSNGWDERVRAEFAAIPDKIALVYGDDGFQHERLATHGFVHRRWVETVGYFVPPKFSSDFNDTWLNEVADRIGRRRYLPDVLTEHMHPAAGKGEWDKTHQERLARHEADRPDRLYAETADDRKADADKLRAVMQ